jgi:hypothetical protein
MDFIQSLQTKDAVTENGMPTNSTSLNRCVDLFFMIGAIRGQHPQRILNLFIKAFYENRTAALRILFWGRDARDGAGERQTFRIIFKWLCDNHPETVTKNLDYVSFLGRWDDYLVAIGTKCEDVVIELIKESLEGNDKLCGKWMPRKGSIANILRKKMKLSPKEYRKLLVKNTDVVETKMCSKSWSDIEYEKIPSLAMSRYSHSFLKNDPNRFTLYLEDLKQGKKKVNAGAVYPYDIIKNLRRGNSELAQEQWNALPNYMAECHDLVFPLVDVSGSMDQPAGKNPNLTCMDVAISLGLYISERNEGPLKNYFMTFSQRPQLVHTVGSLKDRLDQMESSSWGMNTNLIAVFKSMLEHATENNVRACDMPTKILILSDMEFDQAVRNPNNSAMEEIEQMYREHNYTLPKIVFWNIQSRSNNVPVSFNKQGTALVSGFSPSILKSILKMDVANPYKVMLDTINDYKYLGINP